MNTIRRMARLLPWDIDLYLHRTTKQNKNLRYSSMLWIWFKRVIPVFQRPNPNATWTVLALQSTYEGCTSLFSWPEYNAQNSWRIMALTLDTDTSWIQASPLLDAAGSSVVRLAVNREHELWKIRIWKNLVNSWPVKCEYDLFSIPI
jgi:hypothetical protein